MKMFAKEEEFMIHGKNMRMGKKHHRKGSLYTVFQEREGLCETFLALQHT